MYNDIGKKLKGFAVFLFVIAAIIFALGGFVLMFVFGNAVGIIVGLLIIVIGALFSWISSWLLYGFGVLIDKTCDIERNTRQTLPSTATYKNVSKPLPRPENISPAAKEKLDMLDRYYTQGKVSEEDYQMQRANILNNQ